MTGLSARHPDGDSESMTADAVEPEEKEHAI